MPTPKLPISKLLLASALTFAIHSTLHAASDIEAPTPGTGQDASASVTSSDPSNTVTATGGSGAPDANGGNATASATLTPTSDSDSTLTATGGASGSNDLSILPTVGGNATASATINASGNVTLSLTATGGDGSFPLANNALYGNGGNATVSASVIASGNISINATSQGGTGGGFESSPPLEGVGGIASFGTISATSTSGNITLMANQLGGNGNISGFGIGADASITNALSASTSGNITLTQNATGGAGSLPGNANSSLTFICLTAASITATANANLNPALSASFGATNAYADITGTANVTATASATSINGNAPASATAIARGSPFPPSLIFPPTTFVKAIATAASKSASSAHAVSYSSDPYFSSADVFANSTVSGQTICAGFFVGNFPSVTSYISATFPLTAPVSSTNNPDTRSLVTTSISSQFAGLNSPPENIDDGFDGTLDLSSLPAEDLVIKFAPIVFSVQNLQLTVLVNQITELSQSLSNLTFGTNKPIFYDLGPIRNFGVGPLQIHFELSCILPNQFANMQTGVSLYDMDPALLTPEPASLSLLAAATLPLLLKRRRSIPT